MAEYFGGMIMANGIKKVWEFVQSLLDVNGDAVMFLFSLAIIYRIVYGPPLGYSEAAVYASAIGVFGYSNTHPPKSL